MSDRERIKGVELFFSGFSSGFGFDVGFGLGLGGGGDVFRFGFGVGFGFFFSDAGGFDILRTIEFIHGADNNEDDEGDEKEVDDVLKEVAVGDVGDGVGSEEVRNVESKAGKVETAGEEAGDGHDDIVDEGLDNGGEGATNGDTNSEIDDAAAVDELFKFLDEVAFRDASDEAFRSSAGSRGVMFGGCL